MLANLVGLEGIWQWIAEALNPDAKICSAIRPYGLHAGNVSTIVAYPYLVCHEFKKILGKQPRFTYKVWLNDIEPAVIVGPSGRKEGINEANRYPGSTTLQFTPAPNKFSGSLVDYWQPVIEGVVRGTIGKDFPYVKLEFLRASQLSCTPEFQRGVVQSIKKFWQIKEIIEFYAQREVKGKRGFVWPLCPACQKPVTNAKVSQHPQSWAEIISGSHEILPPHRFSECPSNLSWGMNVRILQAIRLAVEQPDLWVIGVDHYPVNSSYMIERIADELGVNRFKNSFLHAPLMFADEDNKVSKSLGHAMYIDPRELITCLQGKDIYGLSLKDAPVSSDIIAVGEEYLPAHMLKDKERRLREHRQFMTDYENSGKRDRFELHAQYGGMPRSCVGALIGAPHL